MSMVYTAKISTGDMRPAYKSVGLICPCGSAVAGIEGVITACKDCGTRYIVTVMALESSKESSTF